MNGITDKSGPQDDKRFMVNHDEESEKKKIHIDFPDIDFPAKHPSPSDAQSGPPAVKMAETKEARQEETPHAVEKETKPLNARAEHAGTAAGGHSPDPVKGLMVIIAVILLSIAGNLYLLYTSSDLKSRLNADSKAVKDVISEKEDLRKAKESLEFGMERLKAETSSISGKFTRIKDEKEKLIAQLLAIKKSNAEAAKRIAKYKADSMKFEAARKKYADALQQERDNAKKLAQIVKRQEEKITAPNSRVGANIDTMPADYEAALSYETGYLYAGAGMFEKAIEKFKRFIELSGENPEAYFNIAYIYHYGIKDTPNALKYYKRYIELAPQASDLYEVKATVDSLERTGAPRKQPNQFKIDLNRLKR